MKAIRLIVFDLDGVITDEKPYWDSAKAAVRRVLAEWGVPGREVPKEPLPQNLVYWLKNRAINNNWDVAYVAACACLYSGDGPRGPLAEHPFLAGAAQLSGVDLLRYAGKKLGSVHAEAQRAALEYGSALSKSCHAVCQEIHDRRVASGEGRHMGVLSTEELRRVMEELFPRYQGRLGVATGRLRSEAIDALEELRVLEFFSPERIVTYNDIVDAEAVLAQDGNPVSLGKPHPFALLKAMHPEASAQTLAGPEIRLRRDDVLFVGDTPSDVYAAAAARVECLCVLGAVRDQAAKEERRSQLQAAGCSMFVESVSELPSFLSRFEEAKDDERVGQ